MFSFFEETFSSLEYVAWYVGNMNPQFLLCQTCAITDVFFFLRCNKWFNDGKTISFIIYFFIFLNKHFFEYYPQLYIPFAYFLANPSKQTFSMDSRFMFIFFCLLFICFLKFIVFSQVLKICHSTRDILWYLESYFNNFLCL